MMENEFELFGLTKEEFDEMLKEIERNRKITNLLSIINFVVILATLIIQLVKLFILR